MDDLHLLSFGHRLCLRTPSIRHKGAVDEDNFRKPAQMFHAIVFPHHSHIFVRCNDIKRRRLGIISKLSKRVSEESASSCITPCTYFFPLKEQLEDTQVVVGMEMGEEDTPKILQFCVHLASAKVAKHLSISPFTRIQQYRTKLWNLDQCRAN